MKTQSGIEISKRHLAIPALGSDTRWVIKEATLAQYSEFLRHWEVAMGLAYGEVSLASLWTHDYVFRGEITEALAALDFDQVDELSPAQLSELVLSCTVEGEDSGDYRGAIFRLHQDVPDPKTLAQNRAPLS